MRPVTRKLELMGSVIMCWLVQQLAITEYTSSTILNQCEKHGFDINKRKER